MTSQVNSDGRNLHTAWYSFNQSEQNQSNNGNNHSQNIAIRTSEDAERSWRKENGESITNYLGRLCKNIGSCVKEYSTKSIKGLDGFLKNIEKTSFENPRAAFVLGGIGMGVGIWLCTTGLGSLAGAPLIATSSVALHGMLKNHSKYREYVCDENPLDKFLSEGDPPPLTIEDLPTHTEHNNSTNVINKDNSASEWHQSKSFLLAVSGEEKSTLKNSKGSSSTANVGGENGVKNFKSISSGHLVDPAKSIRPA